MGSRVAVLARRQLAALRGELPPVEEDERAEVTPAELASHLPAGVLERLPPTERRKLERWAAAAKRGRAEPIRVGPARTSQRVSKRELPLCGAPTHPWIEGGCPSCGEAKARAGRACPNCGTRNEPGPPCRARVARDEAGRPMRRCRCHGGLLRGPATPEGRARSNMNLRRGRAPGAHTEEETR